VSRAEPVAGEKDARHILLDRLERLAAAMAPPAADPGEKER
jgi:hypothetical protein